ncbi:hypothetical protein HWV62_6359 [Athelia sp. TMB]|nr:hypothetical protein HWV62_6359 [Athelia sp. TMB]
MQLSAFVILACALAAIARPIGGDGAKVVASIEREHSSFVISSASDARYPEPVQSEVSDIGNDSGALGNAASLASGDVPARRARRRSLAGDIQPVAAAINPLAQGVDAGLQQGAGNVKAAVQNAGAALDQAGGDVSDIGANTAAGLGQTAGEVPARVLQTVKALEHSALLGSLLGTLFGRSGEASDNQDDSAPLGAVSKPAGGDTPARRTRRPTWNDADTYFTEGANAGLQQGAGNIKAAVQNAGAGLNQAANGVDYFADDTAAGAGQTVGQLPGAAVKTVHTIENTPGIVGSVAGTVFGH